jgi:hypothetical protein
MNTTINNQFVCECCGTTTPCFDEEITVALISTNGVTYKKVCYDCAINIQQTDPRYLFQTSRYLDPEMQEWEDDRDKRWEEQYERCKKEFLTNHRGFEIVKKVIGTRHYEGFVDVTDPCYGSGDCDGKRLPVATGNYTCVAWNLNYTFTFDGKEHPVSDVSTMGIYLNGKIPAHDDMIKVGCIGADSGLLGIFDVKENFDLRCWLDEKNEKGHNDLYETTIHDVGFMTSLGDVDVTIYVAIENGEIVAVEFRYCDYIHRGQ